MSTERPMRRAVVLRVSTQILEELLQLPADVRVTGISPDPVRDTLDFRLESERFEPVDHACHPPEVRAVITRGEGGSSVLFAAPIDIGATEPAAGG